MAEELKSGEMTREEMIHTLRDYCVRRSSCSGCPLKIDSGPWCNNSFGLMINKKLEERMALLEDDDIRKSQLDKDQQAKADARKAPISLVPMEIVWAIAWIRKYGNEKYGDPDNWKTVEPERYRDALMRHLLHYISDPKSVDEESGYPHLWHAACNMAFLMHMDYGEEVLHGIWQRS